MNQARIRTLQIIISLCFILIFFRLFYFQVIARSSLHRLAQDQYNTVSTLEAGRGEILTNDAYPLVTNQPVFTLFAQPQDLRLPPADIARVLTPLVFPFVQSATASAITEESLSLQLTSRLSEIDRNWVALVKNLDRQTKETISSLNIHGLGFDQSLKRTYPEASLAAQLIGFVGADSGGKPTGYFGLEGYYDLELAGRPGLLSEQTDVAGRPIATADFTEIAARPGRTLVTSIDRGVQLLIEKGLLKALTLYGAQSGDISVMDPQTGALIALAGSPSFDPTMFWQYPTATYKLPVIADSFEPGSIFKPLVIAAAIDSGQVQPTDLCERDCAGPVTIGNYSIKTWNNEYHPGQTVGQILERSDNVGMVYVASKLGKNGFLDYLDRFGIGQPTYIDLEGEATPALRESWGDIDIATGAFGQGLAVTSLRMLASMSVIANGGRLYEPKVVTAVISGETTSPVKAKYTDHILKPQTAKIMTDLMVLSAQHGEAKWRLPPGYRIAGKTGTAQVPIAGYYDPDRTIASFIGFAPADEPRFIMLVKLKEPTSSPWASETAAPLWFDLATQLLRYYNLPPTLP